MFSLFLIPLDYQQELLQRLAFGYAIYLDLLTVLHFVMMIPEKDWLKLPEWLYTNSIPKWPKMVLKPYFLDHPLFI